MTAVVFDLDGVLVDSEQVWDGVREELARERGGRWHPGAQRDMMGMSSPEWSRYMHDRIGLAEPPEEINRLVVERMLERYAAGPPWIPGALDAVGRLAAAFPLGLASSSNRELIDAVLTAGGIAGLFQATVSSEETVARNRPAIPPAASTASISSRFDEEASPSGKPAASRRTASSAPGIHGGPAA